VRTGGRHIKRGISGRRRGATNTEGGTAKIAPLPSYKKTNGQPHLFLSSAKGGKRKGGKMLPPAVSPKRIFPRKPEKWLGTNTVEKESQ